MAERRNDSLRVEREGCIAFPPRAALPAKVNDEIAAVPVWLTAERFLFSTPNGIFAGSLTGAKPSLLLPDSFQAPFSFRGPSPVCRTTYSFFAARP